MISEVLLYCGRPTDDATFFLAQFCLARPAATKMDRLHSRSEVTVMDVMLDHIIVISILVIPEHPIAVQCQEFQGFLQLTSHSIKAKHHVDIVC